MECGEDRVTDLWIVEEGTATTVFTTPVREGTFKESELSANDEAAIDSLLAQSTAEDWESRVDPEVHDAEMYLVCVDRPELKVGCGLYTYRDPDISKRPASIRLVELLTTLRRVASTPGP